MISILDLVRLQGCSPHFEEIGLHPNWANNEGFLLIIEVMAQCSPSLWLNLISCATVIAGLYNGLLFALGNCKTSVNMRCKWSAYGERSESYLFLRGLGEVTEKHPWEFWTHRRFPKYAYREESSKTTLCLWNHSVTTERWGHWWEQLVQSSGLPSSAYLLPPHLLRLQVVQQYHLLQDEVQALESDVKMFFLFWLIPR